MQKTYIVVGAGLAGARAVEALRQEGFEGRVVLIGGESHLPYERPPLSKEMMLGTKELENILVHPEQFYIDNQIDLKLGTRALRIDPHDASIETDCGKRLSAHKVLLCTGTRPRQLAVPGAERKGIHTLRDLDDARNIRDLLHTKTSVVIIGAGLIGLELASVATALGNKVTVLEKEPRLLRGAFAEPIGDWLLQLHRRRGIDIQTNVTVQSIDGDAQVRRVRMVDGRVYDADLVIVAVGVEPVIDIARNSGIMTGNGILVDKYCQTSQSSVYAAGDVANHPNSIFVEQVRVEHWSNAQNQSIAAARSMLGRRDPYRDVPWFWSDQGDLNIQVAGRPRASDGLVWRGEPSSGSFTVFHLRNDILVGAVAFNRRRDARMAMDLIDKQARPEPASLANPAVDLRKLGTASF